MVARAQPSYSLGRIMLAERWLGAYVHDRITPASSSSGAHLAGEYYANQFAG